MNYWTITYRPYLHYNTEDTYDPTDSQVSGIQENLSTRVLGYIFITGFISQVAV